MEFCDICDHLFIRPADHKVSLQQIRRDAPCLTPVGAVFFHAHPAEQAKLFHQSGDHFVIADDPSVSQLRGDPSVAVPAAVLLKDLLDLLLHL